ncbi:MAG: hypothetical protein ABI647_27115, partial [Gemmatimonadota bacterium]
PQLRVGRPSVPAQVDAVVSRALAKLPADRFASGAELVQALVGSRVAGEMIATTTTSRAAATNRRLVMLLASMLLGTIAVAVWGWLRPTHTANEVGVKRFEIPLPSDVPAREIAGSRIALAPDGKTLVYLGIADSTRRLFLRRLDQTAAQPLPGTEGASVPFYSPDSKWVGFVARGEMKKVPIEGGDPITLAQIPGTVDGATWGERGVIAFTSSTDRSLWQLPAEGGTPALVIRPDSSKGEVWLSHPAFLPGGDAVLVDRWLSPPASEVMVVTLRTRKAVRLVGGGVAQYARGDTILFFDGESNSLEAVRIDLGKLQMRGSPFPLRVLPNNTLNGWEYACSRDGTLIFLPFPSYETTLVVVDRQGAARPLAADPKAYGNPRFSPNGKRVAVTIPEASGNHIWLYGVADRTVTKLTLAGNVEFPAWTSDGQMIAYYYDRGDTTGVFWTRSDATGSPQPVQLSKQILFPESWTPDGLSIVAEELALRFLWVVPIDSAIKPHRLEEVGYQQAHPALSPDGHWLAYTANESGQWEVYVQAFPGPGSRAQVSLNGGLMPVWNRNGKELSTEAAIGYMRPQSTPDLPSALRTGTCCSSPRNSDRTTFHVTTTSVPMASILSCFSAQTRSRNWSSS